MKRYKTRFSFLIVIGLPLLVAALTMTLATSHMLDVIAKKVNDQDWLRSNQAARSAIHSVESSLEGIVADNAKWDDAVEHAGDQLDPVWVEDTWTVATTDRNYSTFFVVTADGTTLAAGRAGSLVNLKASDYLGDSLALALHDLPLRSDSFETVSTTVKTADGIFVFSMAPISYHTQSKIRRPEHLNYLIFLRPLSADAIDTLGRIYILKNLAFGPVIGNGNENTVFDHWGRPVATLSWTNADPGKAARESSSYTALLGILTLIVVMLPLSILHYGTMVKMDEDEFSAQRLSREDNLTGLHNRAMLIEEMGKLISKATEYDGRLALAFIDLDGFKAVNDTFGHNIGDKLIRAVASGLASLSGTSGVLVRLGGDEFALLLNGLSAEDDLEQFAHNTIRFVEAPFDIEGRLVSIGASIGMAKCTSSLDEISEFMRQADLAMYQAKEQGGNRWKWFDVSLDAERNEELEIVQEFNAILATDTLEIAYQPFVSSQDRSIVGVEALARWPACSERKLTPDRFIPIAEEHGLIDKIGEAVLRKACKDMAGFGDLKVAVNISTLQLRNPLFAKNLQAVLRTLDFDPTRLEVEFTESIMIDSPTRARTAIRDLHAMGVSVALDDFGTGYASVGYLREYAFNKIKLDRGLTQSLACSSLTQNIVQGTVLIAKGLAAQVIAEGIENEEQAILMRLAGCEFLQGYYFGKPQSAVAIGKLLASKGNMQVA